MAVSMLKFTATSAFARQLGQQHQQRRAVSMAVARCRTSGLTHLSSSSSSFQVPWLAAKCVDFRIPANFPYTAIVKSERSFASSSDKRDQYAQLKKYQEDVWEAKFEHLQQFQEEHGDCLVKRDYTTTDDINLGQWVQYQRAQYKKHQEGKKSTMTQEHIEKLESIGFVWDVKESQWNAKFELLQQYKNDQGDCLVPMEYTTSDGVKLGGWVSTQRYQYKKHQEGQQSAMPQERIKKLESIGFVWDARE